MNHRIAHPTERVVNSPGEPGPAGKRGEQGDQGGRGDAGDQGEKGERGIQGVPGLGFLPGLERLGISENTPLATLDPDTVILHVILREMAGFDVIVMLGRKPKTADVLRAVPVPANGTLVFPVSVPVSKSGLQEDIWVSSPAWGRAMLNVSLLCVRAP